MASALGQLKAGDHTFVAADRAADLIGGGSDSQYQQDFSSKFVERTSAEQRAVQLVPLTAA